MTARRATDLLTFRYDTPGNAFFTRWVSQRVGALLAALAFALRLTPNMVTLIGAATALAGCVAFAVATTATDVVIAALLWQLAFAFDCADGQLARATQRQSPYGAWLDIACDHVRNAGVTLAALHVLLAEASLPATLAYAATLMYLGGLSVYLHTASSASVRSAPPLVTHGIRHHARQLIRQATDTPMVLLWLCLLQPIPPLLAAFLSLMGILLLVRAAGIARQRLAPGGPAPSSP
ncbi:MAG: CDP-alcohol phosphatidyltransferase family protein [Pseudomonadota bacterium]|nr:CDP-alcohol phosphatidyltransferase family protein [Pseudomonadota bacterium]